MSLEPVDIDIRMRQNVTEESDKASHSFDNLTKGVTTGGENIDRTLKRLGVGFASTAALTAFGNQIIKVRGEMQMLEVSMETLLGNKKKADAMVKGVMDYVATSPYSLMGVSKGAETLLGFNVAAEKVLPTLKQIGDISRGNEERMSSLILAFSQMSSAGRLLGQDLNQMINAGFNPLQEISRKTGRGLADLKKDMENGAISADMVADAYASATAEGGKFYNMAQKQASGIKGLQGTLNAAMQEMYNDLGERNEKLITDGYQLTTALVKNYEAIGKAAAALIMTYGAYKAAVVITNVVLKEQAAINAMVAASNGVFNKSLAYQWIWTERVQKAQALLNKTMLTNPYVLLATVVVGLAAAAWALHDGLTSDERALKSLNEELEAAKQKKEEVKGKANELISVLNSETSTIYQQIKAWKELQNTIPEAFSGMSMEEFKKLSPADIQMRINIAMDDRELKEAEMRIAAAEANAEKIRKSLEATLTSPAGNNGAWYLAQQLQDAESSARAAKKQLDEINKTRAEAEFNAKPETERLAYYEKELETLKRERSQLESILLHTESINGEWSKFDFHSVMNVSRLNEVNNKLSEIEGNILNITGKGAIPQVQNKSFWQKQAEEAEKALNQMSVAEKSTELWNAELKKLSEAQDKLKVYNFSEKVGKEAAAQLEQERKKAQKIIDITLQLENEEKRIAITRRQSKIENEQAILDLQKDSARKRLDQITLSHRAEKLAIERYEQELIEAQQERERKTWEQEGSNGVFSVKTKTAADLSAEDKEAILDKQKVADERLRLSTESLHNELIEKYKDFAAARLAIETQYNEDIDTLIAARDKAATDEEKDRMTKAIAKATSDKGKALMSFDYDRLKEAPEYVRAFEDLKKTSTETLEHLLSQLETAKQAASKVLSPEDLREYTSNIQRIADELIARNPFKRLAIAQTELLNANKRLIEAKKTLDRVKSGEDKTISLAEANEKYRAALDDVAASSADVVQAQDEIREQTAELFDSINELGSVIGGTTGEIISLIGDIGAFVDTTVEGIELASRTGAQAISAIEKASVILMIITAAIQLMQKLSSLIPDSHQQYLDYADKVNEINKMRDAVNEYEIAVLKAKQAEEGWFSTDNLRSLKQARETHEKITQMYEEKANEMQATYQNEQGGGWLTDLWKPITWVADQTYGKLYGFDINKNYEEGMTKAVENLRIETRKKKKGVLGSGIGAKSQKTEDLTTWVKNNLGYDLFDEKGMIDAKLGREILEKYGEKLVGQTKETLETLVEYKEQYDEYVKQLREYVSSLYEPLVDNFVDSLWDWFDSGKDALSSFKDYAAQTFREIVTDMIKTIVLKNVIGTFGDDISGFYEQYASGKLSEEDLMQLVVNRTSGLVGDMEQQLPVIQTLMLSISDMLKSIGIDISSVSGSTYDSLRDSIKDAWSDGKFDIQDAADFTKNAFKTAMLSALEAKVLNKALDPFIESFAKDAQDGTLFEKMDQYESWIKSIGEEGNAFMESLLSLPGMKDLFDAERTGASAGKASVSQDSANAIEGTMYALRISFNDFFNMYKEEADMREAYMTLLDSIATNVENCFNELSKMNKTLNGFENEGMKWKQR